MRSSIFPDVNVWLAATHQRHVHHQAAADWLGSHTGSDLYFCRFTQLSFLRLLTNERVMGDEVLTQQGAWKAYRRWTNQEPVRFMPEPVPAEFDPLFEKLSADARPSPKLWADAYLAAFARCAGLILVTFDRALSKRAAPNVELLGAAAG